MTQNGTLWDIKMDLGRKVKLLGPVPAQSSPFLSIMTQIICKVVLTSLDYSGLVGQFPVVFHISLFPEVLSCDPSVSLDVCTSYPVHRPDLSLESTNSIVTW